MTPLNALAERKGLFAITALASAILLIGALLPGYYVWTVTYNINPLTENEVIELPKTTGATIDQVIKIPPLLMGALKKAEGGTELSPEEEAFVVGYKEFIAACESEVERLIAEHEDYLIELGYVPPLMLPWGTEFIEQEKKLHIDKPVDVVFQIPLSDAHAVQGRSFWMLVVFIGVFEQGDVDGDGVLYELAGIDILIPSLFQVDEWKKLDSVINLMPGKYDVVMKIFTWTGAVEDFQMPTTGSFRILIYAVEKPLPVTPPEWYTPPLALE